MSNFETYTLGFLLEIRYWILGIIFLLFTTPSLFAILGCPLYIRNHSEIGQGRRKSRMKPSDLLYHASLDLMNAAEMIRLGSVKSVDTSFLWQESDTVAQVGDLLIEIKGLASQGKTQDIIALLDKEVEPRQAAPTTSAAQAEVPPAPGKPATTIDFLPGSPKPECTDL